MYVYINANKKVTIMKLRTFIITGFALLSLMACNNTPTDETERRIEELLSKMTLEEKIGQLNQLTGVGATEERCNQIRNGEVGSILNEVDPVVVNKLQHVAVEESRLGIPIIIARDVIHGFKTIFPIPLGQASTWNEDIVEAGAHWAAYEATSVGVRWTFSPMIDVSRDSRWGRIAESYGEDPLLNARMGAATIKGYQGEDLSNPCKMAACAKHFAGYGVAEAGKDYNTTWIPEVQLRDTYLPPFKAAVEAGAATFMCSFNDINGVPSSGNKHLNIDILRNEWGFDGVLVSDWGSTDQMINHGFVANLKEGAKVSMLAGMDVDMESHAYSRYLAELVKDGAIEESAIDNAVRNVLRLKFRLGLFENPYVETTGVSRFYTDAALSDAQKAAEESTILLKNNGVLPLKDNVKTVAIVGPMANAPIEQVGTWSFDAEANRSITPLAAIRNLYGEQVDVIYEPALTHTRDKSTVGINRAVAAARKVDVVLYFCGEEAILSGEGKCRADISLPGAQTELLEAMKSTNTPIVMVVMTGRAMTIGKEIELSDATLYQFHAGTMTGPSLANIIFGKVSPSGKLPITMPRMVGQIPIYYSHKNTGRPATGITLIEDIPIAAPQFSVGGTCYHLDAGDAPLYPFGYGLSYTTFEYGPVTLSSNEISMNETLIAKCSISNTGLVDAQEVVQLYTRDLVASLCQPIRVLKDFKKVNIPAGQTIEVEFTINASQLGFHTLDSKYIVEPGEFNLWIAPNSAEGSAVSFYVK